MKGNEMQLGYTVKELISELLKYNLEDEVVFLQDGVADDGSDEYLCHICKISEVDGINGNPAVRLS